MTSVLRHEPTASPVITVTAQLWADAAPLLDTGPETYRDTCRQLLDIVIPILSAATSSDHTTWAETSPRIRAISARLTAAGLGVEPIVRGIHGLVAGLLRHVLSGGGATSPTVAREVSATGSRVITDVLTGAHSAAERTTRSIRVKGRSERARELLSGDTTAIDDDYDLAPAYAVIAVHSAKPLEAGHFGRAFEQAAGDGALTAFGPAGGFALLPAEDEARAVQLARRTREALSSPVWMSVSWRTKGEIVSGRREAGRILSLVLATERRPGVYWLDDVLVEYAVACEPSVSGKLVKIITPLLDHPTLFDTLKVLIATDGNRSQAADRLILHRSSLDYRVQRIEQLTGLRSGSVREINVLSMAVTAHAVAAQAERSRPGG